MEKKAGLGKYFEDRRDEMCRLIGYGKRGGKNDSTVFGKSKRKDDSALGKTEGSPSFKVDLNIFDAKKT